MTSTAKAQERMESHDESKVYYIRTFSCLSLIFVQAAVKVDWYWDSNTTYTTLNFLRPFSSGTTLLIRGSRSRWREGGERKEEEEDDGEEGEVRTE